jgi:hypothetical protein
LSELKQIADSKHAVPFFWKGNFNQIFSLKILQQEYESIVLSLCPNGMPVAAIAWSYNIPQLYLNLQLYKINVNSTVVERNAANVRKRIYYSWIRAS